MLLGLWVKSLPGACGVQVGDWHTQLIHRGWAREVQGWMFGKTVILGGSR